MEKTKRFRKYANRSTDINPNINRDILKNESKYIKENVQKDYIAEDNKASKYTKKKLIKDPIELNNSNNNNVENLEISETKQVSGYKSNNPLIKEEKKLASYSKENKQNNININNSKTIESNNVKNTNEKIEKLRNIIQTRNMINEYRGISFFSNVEKSTDTEKEEMKLHEKEKFKNKIDKDKANCDGSINRKNDKNYTDKIIVDKEKIRTSFHPRLYDKNKIITKDIQISPTISSKDNSHNFNVLNENLQTIHGRINNSSKLNYNTKPTEKNRSGSIQANNGDSNAISYNEINSPKQKKTCSLLFIKQTLNSIKQDHSQNTNNNNNIPKYKPLQSERIIPNHHSAVSDITHLNIQCINSSNINNYYYNFTNNAKNFRKNKQFSLCKSIETKPNDEFNTINNNINHHQEIQSLNNISNFDAYNYSTNINFNLSNKTGNSNNTGCNTHHFQGMMRSSSQINVDEQNDNRYLQNNNNKNNNQNYEQTSGNANYYNGINNTNCKKTEYKKYIKMNNNNNNYYDSSNYFTNINTNKNNINSNINNIYESSPKKVSSNYENSLSKLNTERSKNINNINNNINKNSNTMINIQELLLFEEKFTQILYSINNLSPNLHNECFELITFFQYSFLCTKFENYFKSEDSRLTVHNSLLGTLYTIILVYDITFNKIFFRKNSTIITNIFQFYQKSYLLLCEYILTKISANERQNFFVKKLGSMLDVKLVHINNNNVEFNNFKKEHIKENSNLIITEIKFYNLLVVKYTKMLLKNYSVINNIEEFEYFFNNILDINIDELTVFFRRKVFRVFNTNASLLGVDFSVCSNNDNNENRTNINSNEECDDLNDDINILNNYSTNKPESNSFKKNGNFINNRINSKYSKDSNNLLNRPTSFRTKNINNNNTNENNYINNKISNNNNNAIGNLRLNRSKNKYSNNHKSDENPIEDEENINNDKRNINMQSSIEASNSNKINIKRNKNIKNNNDNNSFNNNNSINNISNNNSHNTYNNINVQITINNNQAITVPYLNRKTNKNFSLVLDLDETLICFQVDSTDYHKNSLHIRPYIKEFLDKVCKYYEIIIFTSGTKDYADPLLDIIEKGHNYFDYRLYRQHAIIVENDFVKDLSRLGRDLSKIIIVDNMPQNYRLQKENGIYIKSYWGNDPNDNALFYLGEILEQIALNFEDVRDGIDNYKDDIMSKITSKFFSMDSSITSNSAINTTRKFKNK